MTQLIFEHALRMRIKADTTMDAKSEGKKGKGSTLQGRITNRTLLLYLYTMALMTEE